MANHKSALKRARQSEVRRLRNKHYKTRVKTAIKQVEASMEAGDSEKTKNNLNKEETQLLEHLLYDFHTKFVAKKEQINL